MKTNTEKPKTMDDLTPQIAKQAYELYEQEGRREGHAYEDLLRAEKDIQKNELPK